MRPDTARLAVTVSFAALTALTALGALAACATAEVGAPREASATPAPAARIASARAPEPIGMCLDVPAPVAPPPKADGCASR